MPLAPYVIFGFDVVPGTPNAAKILKSVKAALPPLDGMGPLGVENVYLVSAAPSEVRTLFRQIGRALYEEDDVHGNALRWFVQLCGTSDFYEG